MWFSMAAMFDTVKRRGDDGYMSARSSVDVRSSLLAAARAELAEHGHATISLRAVARRAGVSHAAPKYHFPDRAALLTAVATQGFRELAAALNQAPPSLAATGHIYVQFALANPALFDLMFRPSELHPEDSELTDAQHAAIGMLETAVVGAAGHTPGSSRELTLISWALAHGLAVLTENGALPAANKSRGAAADLARHLVDVYTARISDPLPTGAALG
jgi:AcrR family transcriptional regulator